MDMQRFTLTKQRRIIMLLDMSKKARITYTIEERIRRAFESHASTYGMTFTQLFQKLVEENCQDALERVDQAMAVEESMRTPNERKKK
jgi:uncharacterized protein YfbU (UPF0304 family)